MNDMERLTDAATRHGWTRREVRSDWSPVVYWHRETSEGLQMVEVYRRADGGVNYGHRTWGARTNTRAPEVADQVLAWMQEPTPDDVAQEAAEPVIRPALPFRKQTHDEALHDRLSALQGAAQEVRAPWEGDSRKELDADVLWVVVSDLKRLQEEVTQAIVNAATLAAQRGSGRG